MFPKLFDLGPLTVYSYGVLLAAAYLGGLQLALVRAKRRGLDPARVMDLGIYIIVSALVGLWYVRKHQLPTWRIADVIAPGIALGHVVGRLGCFLAGCCYGHETDVPWAVTFTNPLAQENVGTPLGIPLHPTQLYEAGAEAVILGLLLAFEHKGRAFAGRTFWGYMLVYGLSRFVIEMFRGDPRGMVYGNISTSQFISLLIVPLSLVMLYWLSRRDRDTASVPATPGRTRPARA
jgi:phosphatidylglycerol:prolipoprotein diacylglycerol transferase